jgi:hypothetical protein
MFESVNNCCFQLRAFGGLLAEGTRAWRWQVFMAPSFMPRPLQALGSATQRNLTWRIGQFAAGNWSATAHQWVAVHRAVALGGQPEAAWCAEIGFCYAEIFRLTEVRVSRQNRNPDQVLLLSARASNGS